MVILLAKYLPDICIGILIGIVSTCLGFENLLGYTIIACCFLLLFKQTRWLYLFFVVSFFIGYVITLHADEQILPIQSEWVELTGYVRTQELPSTTQQRLLIEIGENNADLTPGTLLLVKTNRYPSAPKGSEVILSCKLEAPESFEGFHYPRYLASKGIFYLCQNASIQNVQQASFTFSHVLEPPRIWIAKRVQSLWTRPISSLVLGLLLGTRESFPQQTLIDFQRAGVTHIIALSGFNISILIIFLERFLISIYTPKQIRLWVIVGGIIFFTVFVGAGASIVRAAIMGSLAFIAKYSARKTNPIRLMLITASAMTITNPFVLLYDLGFQLSFLSTFGLLYFTPFFQKLFFFVPNVFDLRESLATTMAATITTLPLLLTSFGQLSLISPIANMMILPIIPWLMAIGGLAVLVSIVSSTLAIPLTFLVSIGCQYLLSLSSYFSSLPWALKSIEISIELALVIYLLLILMIWVGKREGGKI